MALRFPASFKAVPLFMASAACVVANRPAWALDPSKAVTQYQLDTWGVKDGLPAHSITDITQSRDGYVWLATQGGLVRFDGAAFTLFDSTRVKTMRSQVWTLSPSRDGGLWAGVFGTGVVRYRDGQASVYPYPTGKQTPFGFVAVYEAPDGSLWMCANHWGTLHLKDGVEVFHHPLDVGRTMLESPDGAVWVGTWGKGLLRIQGQKVQSFTTEQGLPSNIISTLHLDRRGTLWIGTRVGLSRFTDGRFVNYSTRDGLSHDDVRAILDDRDGNLWIGTAGGGLNRLRDGAFTVLRRADGLNDDFVLALHEDDEGGVWVATRGSLSRMRDTSFTTLTSREGLKVDAIVQVREAPDGSLWASTYGGGLSQIKDGRITTYDKRRGLPNDYTGALCVDHEGAVWAGTGTNGLVRLFRGRLTILDTGQRYVKGIGEDRQGLLVALSNAGLHRVEHGRLVPFRTSTGAEIHDQYIFHVHEAKDGTLWVGSSEGLTAVRGGQVIRYTAADGLPEGEIYFIHEDADGALWLATATGLGLFAQGRFARFADLSGAERQAIFTVLEDAAGDIWFNSHTGIFCVSKATLRARSRGTAIDVPVRRFGPRDGLAVMEYTGPTAARACRSRDGRLWFPTNYGLAVVDPLNLLVNRKVPPVQIEEVVTDGAASLAKDGLAIPAGTEYVELRYTALSYTAPALVTFKYILEGFDTRWIDAGPKRAAYYTRLPAGSFRFRVRARNCDGIWNETGATLRLKQLPRYYQTAWFRLGVTLLAVIALVAGHRLRVHQLEARKRELQQTVRDAVAQIKVLSGLLPICANCKKVRNDEGYYVQIEHYIREHSYAEFSHGICPECAQKLYPGLLPPTT